MNMWKRESKQSTKHIFLENQALVYFLNGNAKEEAAINAQRDWDLVKKGRKLFKRPRRNGRVVFPSDTAKAMLYCLVKYRAWNGKLEA